MSAKQWVLFICTQNPKGSSATPITRNLSSKSTHFSIYKPNAFSLNTLEKLQQRVKEHVQVGVATWLARGPRPG